MIDQMANLLALMKMSSFEWTKRFDTARRDMLKTKRVECFRAKVNALVPKVKLPRRMKGTTYPIVKPWRINYSETQLAAMDAMASVRRDRSRSGTRTTPSAFKEAEFAENFSDDPSDSIQSGFSKIEMAPPKQKPKSEKLSKSEREKVREQVKNFKQTKSQ